MDADKFIDDCLDDYDCKMEELYDSAKSSVELEAYHEQVKTEILEQLPQKWRKCMDSTTIPENVRSRTSQKLESTFQKLKRHYDKSQKREQSQLASVTVGKDALNFYNDQMDKYFLNHPNASPKEIEMTHAKVSVATLVYLKNKSETEVGSQLLVTLRNEMEHRRKFYYDKAVMIFKSNMDPAIGIDLGTTMCSIMVFYKGKCEVVPNRSQGSRHTTPSYICFHENTDTFGYVAKEEAYKYPETTIYDAKRMIGRAFTDTNLKSDITKWPFEVVNDNGNAKVKTSSKTRYPHEVSARLLTRFRLMADDHLQLPRGTIEKAVITVPAYFTEPQRRATHEAAVCAGLNVLNILSEPTAAAIAYSWERRESGARRALIYDLGGGTFDVAVAEVDTNYVNILCVDGDTHLGGQDFDQLLMDYCIREFEMKTGSSITSGLNHLQKTERDKARSALCRIKLQCEKAKEALSTADKTTVEIQGVYNSVDMSVVITKSKMEQLVRPLVRQTLDIVEKALLEAKSKGIRDKNDIDDIILVGGSTRMPLVNEMLSTFFGGKQLCKHINPDEAVACGAAIQAAILNKDEQVQKLKVQDVTPMSLGTKVINDRFSIVIPKNTKIPCERQQTYITVADNQTGFDFNIYQGEGEKVHDNKWLGKFGVGDIPKNPAGMEEASCTMTIDKMGILSVTAVSISTGQSNSITITADRMGMDKATMDQLRIEVNYTLLSENCHTLKLFQWAKYITLQCSYFSLV